MRYAVQHHRGAVILEDTQTGRSVFFQPGDDAEAFLTHYEPLAEALGPEQAAAEMWGEYALCAA